MFNDGDNGQTQYCKECQKWAERKKETIREIADDLQERNHSLTLMVEQLEQENKELKQHCKQIDATNKIFYQEKCKLLEENKKLQKQTCPNCGEEILTPSGAELYDKVLDYKQALEKLKEENKNYAKLMLEQQDISQNYWECIEKIKQAIEVLAKTCNVYPLKTNLDKLITTINEVMNEDNI